MPLLEITNLCKSYPQFKLDNVSFFLEKGKIMGFIGRNGAGKSTTIKSMLRLVHPESGKVVINGFDISKNEGEVKNSIGYIIGAECFYEMKKISVITKATKKFFANWSDSTYSSLIKKFSLDESKRIKDLSGGMKIKYQIALAMSHDARLLILDEPTSSLDPVSRDELMALFKEYVSDGARGILFSTHITSDLEKCADSITYIKNGKIIESCAIERFREKYSNIGIPSPTLDDIIVYLEKK